MIARWDYVLAILAMGAVTYFCRAGGYAFLRAVRVPPFVDALLRNLPAPLFAAYVAIALSRQDLAGLVGAVCVVAVQVPTRNLGLGLVGGVAGVAAARALGI